MLQGTLTVVAKRLIANHSAIVQFDLRGCGEPEDRPVTSQLSEPAAKPGMHAFESADCALRYIIQSAMAVRFEPWRPRHVIHALLVGVGEKTDVNIVEELSDGMLSGDQAILALR